MTAWLIVGLGNPGKRYINTRHNAGFMAVDAIAHCHSFSGERSKFDGLYTQGLISGHKVFLLKPQTFMNRSGSSVQRFANFYSIPLSQVIVLHDELDLELNKLRVKTGGGHGGHNGLKSIDSHLGKDYQRIRIGIDRPARKEEVTSYVLQPFAQNELTEMDIFCQHIADHIPLLLEGDAPGFMNKIALCTQV